MPPVGSALRRGARHRKRRSTPLRIKARGRYKSIRIWVHMVALTLPMPHCASTGSVSRMRPRITSMPAWTRRSETVVSASRGLERPTVATKG